MKKIVLIGDSIRLMGYGKPVETRLSDEFEVWQPPENCRFAKHTLRGVWEWNTFIAGADIIHWNNGLWDVCDIYGDGMFTSVDEYVETILRIARLFKQRASTVIFATTTPVRPDNPYNKNSVIEEYNAAVVPKLLEMGIVINDLYTPLSADVQRYISDDKIHLTPDGIAIATDMVEAVIRREAEKLDASNSRVASKKAYDGAPV